MVSTLVLWLTHAGDEQHKGNDRADGRDDGDARDADLCVDEGSREAGDGAATQ